MRHIENLPYTSTNS